MDSHRRSLEAESRAHTAVLSLARNEDDARERTRRDSGRRLRRCHRPRLALPEFRAPALPGVDSGPNRLRERWRRPALHAGGAVVWRSARNGGTPFSRRTIDAIGHAAAADPIR